MKMKRLAAVLMALCVIGAVEMGITTYSASAMEPSPVAVETERPGSQDWRVRQESDDVGLQIKGFANLTSVNVGGSIDFHVSVSEPQPFTIQIHRMGWYQGEGGRLHTTLGPFDGVTQPAPVVSQETGMVTAPWEASASLQIPADWVSGNFIARIVRADGFDNHIPFVVRDDSRSAAIMVQLPYTTYQAYNNFPNDGATGKSLYDFNSFGPAPTGGPADQTRAYEVSFDRPYDRRGAGQFFSYDYPAVRWLERNGYDVVYSTSVDTHTDGQRITNYKSFLSLGHDEYWSADMYDAAERARDDAAGDTDLGFLGANGVYWRIDWEPSPESGRANRVITSRRNFNVDRWRTQGRPEQELMGVMYVSPFSSDFQPLIVASAEDSVWADTGAVEGTAIPGLVGYEIDNLDPNYPGPETDDQTFLSASPFQGNTHQASIYRAPSGSWVFASGTMNWSWGLGNPDFPDTENPIIQKATANVLERFLGDDDGGGGGGGPGPVVGCSFVVADGSTVLSFGDGLPVNRNLLRDGRWIATVTGESSFTDGRVGGVYVVRVRERGTVADITCVAAPM